MSRKRWEWFRGEHEGRPGPLLLIFSIKRRGAALQWCCRTHGHLQTHHLHSLTELPDIAECAISESSAILHNHFRKPSVALCCGIDPLIRLLPAN